MFVAKVINSSPFPLLIMDVEKIMDVEMCTREFSALHVDATPFHINAMHVDANIETKSSLASSFVLKFKAALANLTSHGFFAPDHGLVGIHSYCDGEMDEKTMLRFNDTQYVRQFVRHIKRFAVYDVKCDSNMNGPVPSVLLHWGSFDLSDNLQQIAVAIVTVLKAYNLNVYWNGQYETGILVY